MGLARQLEIYLRDLVTSTESPNTYTLVQTSRYILSPPEGELPGDQGEGEPRLQPKSENKSSS